MVEFLATSQKRGLRRSSLDDNVQNLPKRSKWSFKQNRAYHRLLSGLRRARTLGKPVRFMTLTSSPTSKWRQINPHFQVLRKRIERNFGKIDYIKFRTNEGHGVLHVVYVGTFIPQGWLSRNWNEIHGAYIVDIRKIRGEKRIARYLISNYLVNQTFVRILQCILGVPLSFFQFLLLEFRHGKPSCIFFALWFLNFRSGLLVPYSLVPV